MTICFESYPPYILPAGWEGMPLTFLESGDSFKNVSGQLLLVWRCKRGERHPLLLNCQQPTSADLCRPQTRCHPALAMSLVLRCSRWGVVTPPAPPRSTSQPNTFTFTNGSRIAKGNLTATGFDIDTMCVANLKRIQQQHEVPERYSAKLTIRSILDLTSPVHAGCCFSKKF